MPHRLLTCLTLLLAVSLANVSLLKAQPNPDESPPPDYKSWGAETLKQIHEDYWLPKQGLYTEFARGAKDAPLQSAFMWGVGVQLSAMAAAAKVEPGKYLAETRAYADAIQSYWVKHQDIEAFDVQPHSKEPDRYYDDNAWLVMALAEVYEVTQDKVYLDRAVATFRYVVSCEDDKLGGGLYWREKFHKSKNTCTNAPAIYSALRLHQLTKDVKYLETAKRLYAWTNAHLQDKDGLYWDNIKLSGKVDTRKFTYNTALMIRANCLFYQLTKEAPYLAEAQRIAEAANAKWCPIGGAVPDAGRFVHHLLEAFIDLYLIDRNPRSSQTVQIILEHLHGKLRSAKGLYPYRWDQPMTDSLKDFELLNQSSAARAYWRAAADLK